MEWDAVQQRKGDELLIYRTTWMTLKGIVLKEPDLKKQYYILYDFFYIKF